MYIQILFHSNKVSSTRRCLIYFSVFVYLCCEGLISCTGNSVNGYGKGRMEGGKKAKDNKSNTEEEREKIYIYCIVYV